MKFNLPAGVETAIRAYPVGRVDALDEAACNDLWRRVQHLRVLLRDPELNVETFLSRAQDPDEAEATGALPIETHYDLLWKLTELELAISDRRYRMWRDQSSARPALDPVLIELFGEPGPTDWSGDDDGGPLF